MRRGLFDPSELRPVNGGQAVTLRIGVKPGNVEGLEQAVLKASTPSGKEYQNSLRKIRSSRQSVIC